MTDVIKIRGLDALARAFRELPRNLAAKGLAKPVAEATIVVRDAARVKAPKYEGSIGRGHAQPGTLKRSIFTKREAAGTSQIARYSVFVRHGKKYQKMGKRGANKDAYYAGWVEFGTSKMSGTPYLRPAFEANKQGALEHIVNGLREAVEGCARDVAWHVGDK